MNKSKKVYISIGSVHSPVPLGNLSIRGWGPKRKKKIKGYIFKVSKVKD
jgi:hypothetical protein